MSFKTVFSALAVLAWGVAISGGVSYAFEFDHTPGAAKASPSDWPAATALTRSAGRASLVMFVHPRCPCTRASLARLRDVLDRAHPPIHATVVLMYPPGAPPRWSETDVAAMADRIPNVTLMHDVDGREATRFGAETSGDVMLYSCDGQLLFRGGITNARGHPGEGPAAIALSDFLNDRPTALSRTPIFGCPLFDAK